MMKAFCPNGCESNFQVSIEVHGTSDCEVDALGNIVETIDTDLEEGDPFASDQWECIECNTPVEFKEFKSKKGKRVK